MDSEILIVDDEARFAASLKYLFKTRGVQTRISLTGEDAIRKFRESPVKVVVSDIHMPHQNGFEFMKELTRMDRLVQFIFLTGYASIDYAKQAFKQNAFDFFQKPVEDINTLVDAVRSAQAAYDRLAEEQAAERKMTRDVAAFGRILDGMDAAVLVMDTKTCDILFANRRFSAELGYRDASDLIGKHCLEVIYGNRGNPCRFCPKSRIVDEKGQPAGVFQWETDHPGTGKKYAVMDKAIQWIDGRTVRLSTFLDITKKRRYDLLFRTYEQNMHRLSALENIETLAGGIAHQFNNSLSVISGNLELMEMEMARDEKVVPYARAMKHSADKMAGLTASLLAYARGGKYKVQPFPFHEIIHDLIEDLGRETAGVLRVVNQVPEGSHIVEVDKAQIRMLLANLLENAREAGAQTVEISGGKRLHPAPRVSGTRRTGEHYLLLKIQDDGDGMDRETLGRAFKPFFTTRFQGRGLGLAAAMGIVKGHRGFIFLDSEPGLGTQVRIYLPVAGDRPGSVRSEAS